jgi:hypothetical protein
MIVNHTSQGWQVISHSTHGLLAGKIAQKIKRELRLKNWVDTLTGIIEHDDMLLGFDEKEYLTPNGTPKDFKMAGGTNAQSLEHAKRVYRMALQKSQIIALLVGKQLCFLYDSMAKEYGPMNSFLEEVKELRISQRKLYDLTVVHLEDLHAILLFCDRTSLILVQNKIPEVGKKLDINTTIGNETYCISRRDDASITIEPWIFQDEKFEIGFESRLLTAASFADNQDLKRQLDKAEIVYNEITFKK